MTRQRRDVKRSCRLACVRGGAACPSRARPGSGPHVERQHDRQRGPARRRRRLGVPSGSSGGGGGSSQLAAAPAPEVQLGRELHRASARPATSRRPIGDAVVVSTPPRRAERTAVARRLERQRHAATAAVLAAAASGGDRSRAAATRPTIRVLGLGRARATPRRAVPAYSRPARRATRHRQAVERTGAAPRRRRRRRLHVYPYYSVLSVGLLGRGLRLRPRLPLLRPVRTAATATATAIPTATAATAVAAAATVTAAAAAATTSASRTATTARCA